METLLLLTYAAICVAVFKVFRIPLNKWTVPTAVLGGVVLVGSIVMVMNYNHPYSEATREYFVSTAIVPNVSGTVIEVHAKPNVFMNKGDLLFQIDPAPFEDKKAAVEARLKAADANYKRAERLIRQGSISQQQFDQMQSNFDDLTAQLSEANYRLEQTTVKAPTDGLIVQEFLRPGMRAVAMPLRPAMVFIHNEKRRYTAFFRQNNILRIEPGLKAEIAFDSIPGTVFSAEVAYKVSAIKAGQLQASGTMLDINLPEAAGRVPVVLEITDPRFEQYQKSLPGGIYGQAAVYSEHAEHFAIIRKILLRMNAWLNYLFPFH
jgi:multidrug resistance efflux pump